MEKREKYELISKLVRDTARRVTGSRSAWLEYLATAASVYKYPFREQLLIYAQRPGATACASMEVWNKRMGCRVKRGARGIALIDEDNSNPKVRYVFDAADVYKTKSGQLPRQWRVETEHEQEVLAYIEKIYGRTERGPSFGACIRKLAEKIADACCGEAARAVQSVSGGSAFEETPLPEIEQAVRETMADSIEYVVLSACGRNGENSSPVEKVSLEHITKFNTSDVLCVLGDTTNHEVRLFMQEIKRGVLSCERNSSNQEQGLAQNADRDYNTLKRESKSVLRENDNTEERGADHGRTDIQMGRGLSDSQYQNGRAAGGEAHEVRPAEAQIPEGAQKRDIFGNAAFKQTQGSPAGDTGAGRGADGSNRGADGERRRRGRSFEGAKSDVVDSENGEHPAVSGGDRSERDHLQLNQYKQMSLGNFLISSEMQEQADKTEAAETDTNHIDSAAFSIQEAVSRQNYSIPDGGSGGTAKEKFRRNVLAIKTLQLIEAGGRVATVAEQRILAQYTGWGGIPDAFDETKSNWTAEYNELKSLLSAEEYAAARESTLNAFYTDSVIINSIYDTLWEMGFRKGNILDPAMGTGNFFGRLPEDMRESRLYGAELDGITGRIAKQLYPKADIKISGFEKTDYPNDFFDVAVGNVPFGQYKVADKAYDKHNLLIHDYFFAKTLDKVRPGGVVAFVTSKGTMDKKSPEVRKYLAQRAELLGAVRLPNTAFKDAGTSVTSDILFLKKRDRMVAVNPEWEWLHLTEDENGVVINQYFAEHPEMVLGKMEMVSGAHGMEATCMPDTTVPLPEQLRHAMSRISGSIDAVELISVEETKAGECIPASADVKNYSYAIVDGRIYYREDSVMRPVTVPETTGRRIKGMVHIRDCAQALINMQLEEYPDTDIVSKRSELNRLYDDFSAKYGIINSTANKRAFKGDASYCLLCSLEKTDEEGNFLGKADMFAKRTIRKAVAVTSVDTAAEALTVSLAERACVDIGYMSELAGKSQEDVTEELQGIIFKNPLSDAWETADEYLSGNVREKLAVAQASAGERPEFAINVKRLEQVQPKDLDASEIEIRLGATWLPDAEKYIERFMWDVFKTPEYLFERNIINVQYSQVTGRWNVSGKNVDTGNTLVTMTYGTERVNAYKLLEDSLNLCDVRIFDTVVSDNGSEKRVLNQKETMLVGQKQEAIREAFKDWIFRDPDRRQTLCAKYNELFNATRPREYDGSHLKLPGMTPDIELKTHQLNAVAHQLYGGNTLLAHCVGAGKTFEMIAAAMESKRLGLCRKSLFVVPNHLTEQWAGDFLRLYPGANILAATKRDFEPDNRKKFCSRIATGEYDAVIIGHSQFEKIPLSRERQIATIEQQIREITMAIDAAKAAKGERYSVKEMEKTRKSLSVRLGRLNSAEKDDVVTFEQLGIDRLFVDESHNYKNLFVYTKMRNVAGIAQTEAQKSSDMYAKCRYMDDVICCEL